MRNKNQDLEKIAISLDITPTMYQYAVDRYNGMASFLQGKGVSAEIYPQGSFRTGTVVRPMKDGREADYDIDLVCELALRKEATAPCFVKNIVGDLLKNDGVYAPKLRPEENRCWTLDYADVSDGIGLSMDVVPCVHESDNGMMLLRIKGVPPEYANEAVEITDRISAGHYEWLPSNPSGYGKWFDDINRRFMEHNFRERKARFFTENRNLFAANAKVEEVPDALIKSSLQRTIQLLKRHRDIFYYRAKAWDKRPISAIIVTLSALIAKNSTYLNLDDLLPYVANGMADYAELLQGRRPRNETAAAPKSYIRREMQKWVIRNPVNPDDNFADTWDDDTAAMFFKWVSAVEDELGHSTPIEERKYITSLQRAFGSSAVEKAIGPIAAAPGIITSQSTSKPISPTRPWGGE